MTEKLKPLNKMQELAVLAGVSVSTVSRSLAGSTLINEKTRKRIVALAKKHNYQVNETARNFRLKKTNMISVVMLLDEKSGQHISDMFFLEMLGAIADALTAQGYDLLLTKAPQNSVLEICNSRTFSQSDGIIFVGQGDQNDNLNELSERGKPMVVWGTNQADKKYCTVGGNNELGGYLATKHLLNLGRSKVAFMGDISLPEPDSRFQGYLRALDEVGIKYNKKLQKNVAFDMAHASDDIADFLQSNVEFDAAVCCSDLMAISAMGAIGESGKRVPEDVAIVGYDDISLACYSSPSLTTVRQDINKGGRIIVQKMISQINGDTVNDSVLNTELIVRRSSGAW